MDIAIFGAGGFGREIKQLLDAVNKSIIVPWNLIGYFDDGMIKNEKLGDLPILGGINELNGWKRKLGLVVAIGDPNVKKKIISEIDNTLIYFPSIIHPNVAISSEDVEIAEGCIICDGVIITCNVKINKFVIVNLSTTIGHDTRIGMWSSIMPGVNISGEVNICDEVYIGSGATLINRVEVGSNVILGAGAVVSSSIPSNCTAVGVPAKPIKFHEK